jgi:hypothetical protein
MNASPLQRILISLEKLNTLRDKVCHAYSVSKGGEELQTPNNKNSVYYSELKEDIFLKTKKKISEGTLLKFFHNDFNRTYHVIIISAIEEYIFSLITDKENDKKSSILVHDEKIQMFVSKIYIELITRKAGIPIQEDKDVIEEVYNSWHNLFCIIRDEMGKLPAIYLKKSEISNPIIEITNKILEEILRPHLTEHQAKFRSWLGKAKQNPKYENISPQELQKRYPDYKALMKSMKQVNGMLIKSAERLCELIK